MKTVKLTILVTMVMLVQSSEGQGTFQNLNFESANLSPTPSSGPPLYVPIASALPGWIAYTGADEVTQVLQNNYTLGQASVDIFGPNYTTAGPPNEGPPGI